MTDTLITTEIRTLIRIYSTFLPTDTCSAVSSCQKKGFRA